jgi:hypothetical protein
MADQTTADLPEGTDTVIKGASGTSSSSGATFTTERTADVIQREEIEDEANIKRPVTGSSSSSRSAGGSLSERLRSGREQIASQAGERTRGLVTQGLERTAEALANVSRMVGDTAPGIEERLGADYGDYARRAAGALESAANNLADKDPDELIDDTRNFVRNSPGIALAGAAVVGFVMARLLKTGLAAARDGTDDEDDRD